MKIFGGSIGLGFAIVAKGARRGWRRYRAKLLLRIAAVDCDDCAPPTVSPFLIGINDELMLLHGLCRRGPQVEGEHPGAMRLIHNCFSDPCDTGRKGRSEMSAHVFLSHSTADKLAVEKL
jgi:hypothetical protein